MGGMDEQELARELDASRDDPNEWGIPEPATAEPVRKSEKRQRGVVVSVRLTPAEFERLQEVAAGAGLPVSTYLRDLALVRATSSAAAWRPDVYHQTGSSTVVTMSTPYVPGVLASTSAG